MVDLHHPQLFVLLLAACILVSTLATNLNIKTNVKTMSAQQTLVLRD
jgi:hypothetical protein